MSTSLIHHMCVYYYFKFMSLLYISRICKLRAVAIIRIRLRTAYLYNDFHRLRVPLANLAWKAQLTAL